jgi:hypothetical protein
VVWTNSIIVFNKHFHVLLPISALLQALVHSVSSYFSIVRVEKGVVISILERALNTRDAPVYRIAVLCDPCFLLEA